MKTRTSWSPELIESRLIAVVESTGEMPSNNTLITMGQGDLAQAIAKYGGFMEWARRIGAARPGSDTDTGWDGEKALALLLDKNGFAVSRAEGVKSPFDLMVDEQVRIDVKSANYAEYGACRGWFYRLGKYPQADILAFYQLDTGDCYFIPWQLCPKSNVTISRSGGKYAKFKNRYDIVAAIRDARKTEMAEWPSLTDGDRVMMDIAKEIIAA